jgi:amino acid transporter
MSSTIDAPSGALGGKKVLGLPSVIAQSIGFVGPVFSATFLLPSVAGLNASGKGAGVASPLAVLIATIGLGGVAWIMSRYAKRVHHAGAVYEYVNNGFGSRVGFLGGWIYYGGMLGLATAIFPAFGGFLQGTLATELGWDVNWLVLALACVLVVTALVVIGIEISVRVQLAIATVSIAVVFLFALKVILTGGPAGNSADAFNPSVGGGSGLLFGLVYACLAFTGFESSANLAEETGDPGRAIPRAMLGCIGLVGVFYTVVMYALVSAFGFDMDKFAAGFPQLLVAAGTPGVGGSLLGSVVDWVIIVDVFAVALGVATAISRGLYAMARDGHFPKALAGLHAARRTPVNAAVFVGALGLLVCVAAQVFDGIVAPQRGPDGAIVDPGPWFRIFQWEAAWGALGLIIVYGIVALSGFRAHPGESRVGTGIAAVLGLGASGAAVFGTIYKAPADFNLNSVWWVMVIWIAIGAVLMVVNPNAARLGERQ